MLVLNILMTSLAALVAAGPAEPPAGGGPVIDPEALLGEAALSDTPLGIHRGADAQRTVVDVGHEAFDRAVRVRTIDSPREKWTVKLDLPIDRGAVRQGDTLLVDFWMRTLATADESGDGSVFVVLATDGPRWIRHRVFTAGAGQAWRRWQMPIRMHRGPGEGRLLLSLQFAGLPQTVEVGGLRLVNHGPEVDPATLPVTRGTYAGRDADAAWRKAAAERIERHRKADLTVKVVDAAGNPVPGAAVRVEQQRHAFGFGSVINPQTFAADDADGRRYRELFAEHFNKAPTESGFRWPHWLPGGRLSVEQRKARLSRLLDWLNERGIEVRGHYLMWAPIRKRSKPADLIDKPAQLIEAKWAHAEAMATWAGQRVQEWDAVNHIAGWGKTFADIGGGNRVYAEMIRKGRRWAPHAEMWVNEGQILVGDAGRLDAYKRIIDDLVAMDAGPDGIGFMAHFRDTHLPHPQTVYERIDAFAGYRCKLQLTEFDVDCGADEQLQADYLRDVMTVAFSHRQVEGIVLWGFWEGRHWRPDAALWRKDWSIKPAGQAWIELVRERWWTDATAETDKGGTFRTRGFLGDYTITVGEGDAAVEHPLALPGEGTTVTITINEDQR